MNDRFLRACRLQPVDRTPLWFMRQAGRYMAEYRALREKHTLLELCRTPELAVEVTLQPVKRLPVDAAIVFADILLPLTPLGAPFEFARGEGPVIHHPLRTRADIDALHPFPVEEGLGYVLEALRLLRKELSVPLIGFAGAPFTLASYLIEGGRSSHFDKTKGLMYGEPAAWDALMSLLADTVGEFLVAQARAGAQCLQLFDSWVGALGPDDYEEFVLPYTARVFAKARDAGVPLIHFGTGTSTLLHLQRRAGGDVLGADWRIPLDEAWDRVGRDVAIQGNLDPVALLAPTEVLERRVRAVLARAQNRDGHIFNLGHGILPQTPVDAVQRVADLVHAETERRP